MQILRAADRIAVPWKNGGGVTREVCAVPESPGFDFAWRLSVAEVHASGPFSTFPNIDRKLAVVKGRMRLSVDGNASTDLLPNSPPLSFEGEAGTFAEVLEPVTDANLMTRRGLYCGLLDWIDVDQAIKVGDQYAETVLLAVDPVELPDCTLQPLDAVWCESGSCTTVRPIAKAARMLVAKIWRADAAC